jgi:hypothetical protein
MKQLLSTYQPSATAFNGLGVYDPHDDGTRMSNNSVRWIGAESGEPNVDDIWSTATQDGLYSGDQSPTSPPDWACTCASNKSVMETKLENSTSAHGPKRTRYSASRHPPSHSRGSW